MRWITRLAILGFMTTLGHPVVAMDWTAKLDSRHLEGMPVQAREQYDAALVEFDRVNYEGGLKYLAKAAELNPENAQLQLFLLARARERAEVYYSAASYRPVPERMDWATPQWATSEPYLAMASAALERLIDNPELSLEQRRRVQAQTTAIRELREDLPKRDAARYGSANTLVSEIRFFRMVEMNLEEIPEGVGRDEAYGMLKARGAVEEVAEGAEETEEPTESTVSDPFELLPGEKLDDWMPRPQPGVIGRVVQQGVDQFGQPGGFSAQPGAQPGFGPPPAAGAAAPADPFGGGGFGPAPAAPAGGAPDPFGAAPAAGAGRAAEPIDPFGGAPM